MDSLKLEQSVMSQLKLKEPASATEITSLLAYVQRTYGTTLGEDYVAFLRTSDGCTGIGPNLFVILDAADEVPATTEGYGATEFAPGMVIIGSDGCGNILGIDTRQGSPTNERYVWVDPVELGWEEVQHRAGSLAEMLAYLDSYYGKLAKGG